MRTMASMRLPTSLYGVVEGVVDRVLDSVVGLVGADGITGESGDVIEENSVQVNRRSASSLSPQSKSAPQSTQAPGHRGCLPASPSARR